MTYKYYAIEKGNRSLLYRYTDNTDPQCIASIFNNPCFSYYEARKALAEKAGIDIEEVYFNIKYT